MHLAEATSNAHGHEDARLALALSACERALGREHVVSRSEELRLHEANVTAFARRIAGVVLPGTTEDVQAVVHIARRHGVPLYPVSSGKNWGLGSRLPVRTGAVLVDLKRMRAIRALDAANLYATVEPGVTQRQLYAAICAQRLPVTLNVTGSSADTSLIGNALERGIGYFGSRADETWNFEVVLGTGEILRTGFGHSPGSMMAPLYRHGIGPSLDGLFFQGNFGIVTAATIALRPAPPRFAAAVVSVDADAELRCLVDALAWARRAGCFDTVVHIGDRARTRTTLAPLVARALKQGGGVSAAAARTSALALLDAQRFGAWSGLVGLSGTPARIREAIAELRGRIRRFGRLRIIDDRRIAWAMRVARLLRPIAAIRGQAALVEAIAPLYGLTRGIPTNAAVASVGYAALNELEDPAPEPDHGGAGMLYCLPLMPLCGAAAEEARQVVRAFEVRYGIEISVTFNVVDTRVLEAVITIPFRRDDAEAAARAQRCNGEMRALFLSKGFSPYRVDIEAMSEVVDPSDVFWQRVLALKDVFDPERIIARGRYNGD